jgi:hypothetical protein
MAWNVSRNSSQRVLLSWFRERVSWSVRVTVRSRALIRIVRQPSRRGDTVPQPACSLCGDTLLLIPTAFCRLPTHQGGRTRPVGRSAAPHRPGAGSAKQWSPFRAARNTTVLKVDPDRGAIVVDAASHIQGASEQCNAPISANGGGAMGTDRRGAAPVYTDAAPYRVVPSASGRSAIGVYPSIGSILLALTPRDAERRFYSAGMQHRFLSYSTVQVSSPCSAR